MKKAISLAMKIARYYYIKFWVDMGFGEPPTLHEYIFSFLLSYFLITMLLFYLFFFY